MANRNSKFLLKRSNIPGKVPSPGDLQLGELALNTADAILYVSGTTSNQILPIGWDRLSILSGGTVNGSISATTYYGDGSNLTGINDYYVTGGTYNSGTNTLTLNRQNGSVVITGFTSGSSGGTGVDTYVTGFTYNGVNKLTISQNQGQPNLDVYLNNFSAVTASTLFVDYIDFNPNATVTQSEGRVSWDSGTGTLNIAVGDSGTGFIDLQVGQEEIVRVYNDEITTLQKGEIVYVSGSQGNRPKVKRASAVNDGYSVTTLGMVDNPISSGSEGYVTTFGIISNLNTLGLTGGTPIWLSPTTPGAYTSTKPIAPSHTVLIGYVVRVDATVGSIFVNISNGWELDELHDVRISAATQGDLLMRSSYSGSPVWINTKTLTGNYTIGGNLSATTINTTSLGQSGNCVTDLYIGNIYGCSPITLHDSLQFLGSNATGVLSLSNGLNTESKGNYSHAEGFQSLSGYLGYLTIPSGITNGVITLDSSYGDVTSEFTSNIYLTDFNYDVIYYTNEYDISSLTFFGGNTIITLNDTTVNTTTAIIGSVGNVTPLNADKTLGDYSHAEGYNSSSIGYGSHAEGNFTKSISEFSHSEGDSTIAKGYSSHAEGISTIANGNYSHAEGQLSYTTGIGSHAEGYNTQSSGNYSHSEGYLTQSIGGASHTEGVSTIATGYGSHAEGELTATNREYSHTEGFTTQTYGRYSHAEGDTTISGGEASHAEGNLTISGAFGYTITFINGFGQFDSSIGDITNYFDKYVIIDDYLVSGIYGYYEVSGATFNGTETELQLVDTTINVVKATLSFPNIESLFKPDTNTGYYSHSEGLSGVTHGLWSHAEGNKTKSIGLWSHSEGKDTISWGTGSHTQGISTNTYSDYSFASGSGSTASGQTTFIHSVDSLVTGNRSVVLGGQNITGTTDDTVYLPNLNINYTPTTNNSGTDILIRESDGSLSIRSSSTIEYYLKNQVTVGLSGSGLVDYYTIKDAVNSITASSSSNTYTVLVGPGVFYEDPFTIPTWVAVVGSSSLSTIIEANDPSQTLINLNDQSAIFDCQIQGCTNTGVSAVVYSSSTTPQSKAISYVENVRFGSNYTHAKVVAYGGANIIMQCSNVKYGGYPFTEGFYATNSGSGVGRMQLRNVTSTNGGIVTTSGLIFAKADAPSCGFIVNGCLLTKAVGAASGKGFYVENGGFLRLTGVNFQRWDVGIDAPQVGSAPSIDAIALNFENCNTDVNIDHSGATGKIQGTDNFLKTKININAPIYEVNTDAREIIVAKKGGDFLSIKSAVDYLIASGNTSSNNRYVITVGPGEFGESEIDLTQTPYVSIIGSNIQTTLITPTGPAQHIIKLGVNNEISFLSLSGAPSGYAGIYVYDIGDFGQAHKVSFYDCDTNVWIESVTQDTKFYGEYLDYNGEYTYGTKVIANNNYLALANVENYYNFPSGSNITYSNYVTGSGATLSVFVGDNVSNGVSGTTAFYIQDGAELNASTITADGNTYGIYNPNIGDPVRFDVDNASFVNSEWDLYIERNGTFGTFGGSSSHKKIYTVSSDVYWAFLDIDDGEFDITRKASVTFTDGTHTDFTTLLFEGSSMGLMDGGAITIISGFTVNTASGYGYLAKTLSPDIHMRIDWSNSQITLGANENKYIYINENSLLTSSGTKPSSVNNIILGRVITNSTGISFIDPSPVHSDHTSNRFGSLFREAMGPIYASGSIVTEGTTPFTLNVTNGEYYYSSNKYLPVGGTGITFNQYYRDGLGSWVTTATTIVNKTSYDGNGVLSALTTGYYTKHTLYLIGDGTYEKYFLVLGQNEYSTLVEAENALLPTPPTFFSDSVTQVANIYIEQGTTGITQFEDIRPTIAFRAGGVNASSVHGNLLGLSADDHTQYLLVNGGRSMSGNLNMGSNNITNVNLVDGVDVSSHATRHQFGGLDPVGSVTPLANAIPYADVSGTLDSWVSTASTTTLGKVTLSTTPVSASNPIVIGNNDLRVTKAVTGGTFNSGTNTLSLTTNDGSSISITGFTSSGGGLKTKAGSVTAVSFTGNPKKYTVTFSTAYPNTLYTISITGSDSRSFTYESKSTTGFVINTNANTALTGNVDWQTIAIGES